MEDPVWKPMASAPRQHNQPILVSNGRHVAIARWRRITFDEGFVMDGALRPFWPWHDALLEWKWTEIPSWEPDDGL